ncbi:uncharacterized protein [Penaeus vannamei]|uniref:uncharacterized protein n=1 Tax=Penaeus vannamei TaxID=6689 RepID=UPI00387FAB7D
MSTNTLSEDELRNDETSSIGSGDSVLVGVEDNPEFKNYINRRADAPAPSECASGARSIDQVSAPAAFTETTRSNPLLDMGEVGKYSSYLRCEFALQDHTRKKYVIKIRSKGFQHYQKLVAEYRFDIQLSNAFIIHIKDMLDSSVLNDK